MTRKSVLAASLLGVAWAAPAAAIEKAAPLQETAKPCPEWGPGFVHVPGSTTCLRVKGRVRAEYGAATGRRVSREDIAGFGAGGRVEFDARSQTEFGALRTVVRVRGGRNSGAE